MTGVDVREGGAAVQLETVVADVGAIEDETRRPDAASGAVVQAVLCLQVLWCGSSPRSKSVVEG